MSGDNHFAFIAPMYNASKYVGQMLSSLVAQSYSNWSLILIDDISSDEERKASTSIISAYQNLLQDQRNKITVVWNHENGRGKQWEVSNVLYGISKCNDDDIICRIDADDWLTDTDALTIINEAYKQTSCDVLWTAHRWGFSDTNISAPMPPSANPYKYPWVSSHLKTFRKKSLTTSMMKISVEKMAPILKELVIKQSFFLYYIKHQKEFICHE